jgi:flagellar protein FliJ
MTEPFRLQPLLDLATDRMDEAARILGELISGEQECQRKLESLERYRAEYQARFQEAASKGIGPDAWRNFSTFLRRIDDAIAAQRADLEQSRQATAGGQQDWLAQRNKFKAFDTLSQRHQAVQARREHRDEQRLSDEHGAKVHRERDPDEEV